MDAKQAWEITKPVLEAKKDWIKERELLEISSYINLIKKEAEKGFTYICVSGGLSNLQVKIFKGLGYKVTEGTSAYSVTTIEWDPPKEKPVSRIRAFMHKWGVL